MTMKLFDKAVELAQPVRALSAGLKMCAEQMKAIAEALAMIAYNQQVHHEMIMQLHASQRAVIAKLSSSGTDASMPDIEGKKHSKTEKPN
jgi:hypothetical protein